MSRGGLILVCGAAGRIGGAGDDVVKLLRVSAICPCGHYTDDGRAQALRATGIEVVVGDLTRAEDVARGLEGCRRMHFGMNVSPFGLFSFLPHAFRISASDEDQENLSTRYA